jgi:hypothetical protein
VTIALQDLEVLRDRTFNTASKGLELDHQVLLHIELTYECLMCQLEGPGPVKEQLLSIQDTRRADVAALLARQVDEGPSA